MFSVLAGSTGLFTGLSALAIWKIGMGMDQEWYLYSASRALAGADIYGTEVLETNPPYIVWFHALPVGLARLLHISNENGLRVLIVIATLGSLAWCNSLIKRAIPQRARVSTWLLAFAFAALTLAGALKSMTGQREHILTLCLLPYFFAAGLRAGQKQLSTAEAVALGLAGAIGVCCKPYQLLAIVAAELMLVILRRSLRTLWRPELVTMVLACAAYLICVRWFVPQYLADEVPVLRLTYWAYQGIPFADMALKPRSLITLATILGAGVATWRMRAKLHAPYSIAVLLAAATGSLTAFLVQGTNFGYQLVPAMWFATCAVVVLLAELAGKELRESARSWSNAAVFAAMFLVGALCFPAIAPKPSKADQESSPKVEAILNSEPPGTHVYWMETTMGFFPAAVNHHFFYASRFVNVWMLPSILRNEQHQPGLRKQLSPSQLASVSQIQRDDLLDDFHRWQPALVAVERCNDPSLEPCQALGNGRADLLGWFLRDPRFQQVWTHYKFVATAGRFDFYKLENQR